VMFQRQKSIDELEEEGEKLDSEIGVARKRALLAELRQKGGAGFWKRFSSDGRGCCNCTVEQPASNKSGINRKIALLIFPFYPCAAVTLTVIVFCVPSVKDVGAF